MVTRSKVSLFKPKLHLAVYQELKTASVKLVLHDPKWRQVMQAEFDALRDNNIWVLIHKETAQKVAGNK